MNQGVVVPADEKKTSAPYPARRNNNNQVAGTLVAGAACGVGIIACGAIAACICVCAIIVVIIFAVLAAIAAGFSDSDLGQALLVEETRVGNAYIGLFIINELDPAERAAFDSATARWSAIVGGTLGQFTGRTFFPDEELCQGDLKSNGTFVADHLMIAARIEPIDGRNGILGFAGPCELDSTTFFPILGEMVFDKADVEEMIEDDVLNAVILHEMGHVLGLGTLWNRAIQGEIVSSASSNNRLLADPVLNLPFFGVITVRQTTEQPKFIGTAATAEFRIAASDEELTFVPVEDGTFNGEEIFPGGRQNGAGSIDGHWDLEPLGNELMTFQIDPDAPDHPLSSITIASLEDMGYIVDLNLADGFIINSAKGEKQNLRGKKYVLSGDILHRLP